MSNQWDLNDLYTGFDAPEFTRDFDGLADTIAAMNQMAADMKDFKDVKSLIEKLEGFASVTNRLGGYAGFVFSTNTADPSATKYLYKLEEQAAETSRLEVRLAAFLAELSKKEDISALAETHGLGDYRYQFRRMVEKHRHMMSEDEETLASKMMATGSSAWDMLHEKLVSNLTCEYADPKKNGEIRVISISDCRNLAYDADAAVRKAAYEAELAAYPKIAEASAAAINGIKGEVNLLSRLRKYESPLAQQLIENGMTQKTLDAMFAAMDDNIQVFRDYLKAKAKYLSKTLGKPCNSLPFYDLFAPVGAVSGAGFTYDEAKKFVMDNFKRFSPKMAEVAQLSFDKNWIDVYPRDGKVSGAFCGSVYAVKQFRIMLNYGDSISDAITLAHELGHGYHAMNIMEERVLNNDYPMPLAETASTFCENIVNNAALKTLPDEEKLRILENSLQDSTQVIVDIYSRFLFEKSVFEARADHPLSVEELNELMINAQKQAYGDGLDPEFLHPSMWVIKPHYYSGRSSYYNFPYAFGHLLANGLYAMYEADPDSFGGKYDTFLRGTGKMSIEDICASVGMDVEDKNFWSDAMGVLKERVAEFIKLAEK
jgi:pepF/M3 family oligoendopeptidase